MCGVRGDKYSHKRAKKISKIIYKVNMNLSLLLILCTLDFVPCKSKYSCSLDSSTLSNNTVHFEHIDFPYAC